ncbi:MAG: hypothetical protein KJO62_00100 [Gammaproteobacteria bacterium]|nr:hypothetical protein [Gammaproteobacteria bacterium]
MHNTSRFAAGFSRNCFRRRTGANAFVHLAALRLQALRLSAVLLLACLLAGCIDSDNNQQSFVLPPLNALDFPARGAVVATDANGLVMNGLVLASSSASIAGDIQIRIDDISDADPQVISGPGLENSTEQTNFFWQQALLAPNLPLGISFLQVDANFGTATTSSTAIAVRGSSWMWQAAIQPDDSQGARRWLLLDTARRALIELETALDPDTSERVFTGAQSIFSRPADGLGIELNEPVDFAIDGGRALVVDRGLKAIVEINLADGTRSIFSDALTPNASAPLLDDPVAIAVDSAASVAYVVDRDLVDEASGSIIRLALADGTGVVEGERCEFTVAPADAAVLYPTVEEPEAINPAIVNPADIAVQTAPVARLLVSDRAANTIIEVSTSADACVGGTDAESKRLVSPSEIVGSDANGDFVLGSGDTIAADDTDTETEDVFYSRVGHLAMLGNRLFVSDSGQFASFSEDGFPLSINGAIIEIDISGTAGMGGTDGERRFLSAIEPDFDNPFAAPLALALDDADNAQADDDRLLVLDNDLGAIVAVEIVETEAGVDEPPVSLGRRTYLPGGVVLNQAALDNDELSRAQGLSAEAVEKIENPVDVLGSRGQMFVLDRTQNDFFQVTNASGTRGRISASIGSPADDSQEAQDAVLEAFNATTLQSPAAFGFADDGSGFYIVDAYDDTLVYAPINSFDLTSVRSLASASQAPAFVETRAIAGFNQLLAPDSTDTAEAYVYALQGSDIIEVDVGENADSGANRASFAVAGCTLTDPGAMLLEHDTTLVEDETLGNYLLTVASTLLVVEAQSREIHVIDRASGDCVTTSAFDYSGNDINAADTRIVDALATSTADGSFALLLLDAGHGAVIRVPLDFVNDENGLSPTVTVEAAQVLSSNGLPAAGGNKLRSPIGMDINEQDKQVFVFDSVLRSMYLIDIAERDGSTGRRLTAAEIDAAASPVINGQRMMISRGTSLNCHEELLGLLEPCAL